MTQLKEDMQKWLGITALEQGLASARQGIAIPKSVGSGGGQGANNSSADSGEGEDVPTEGGENEGLKKPLQPGDEPEKFKLKDCETGEEVTLDGLGNKDNTSPSYPSNFDDCKQKNAGPMYFEMITVGQGNVATNTSQTADYGAAYNWFTGQEGAMSLTPPLPPYDGIHETKILLGSRGNNWVISDPRYRGYQLYAANKNTNPSDEDLFDWPATDKNHLVLTDEGCFGTLCPEFNTQVSVKFQGCQDEMILCDEDGNKVHVKVNSDGSVNVTQEKFGQSATVKNGKVASVKKLTDTQLDRIFN